MKITERIDAITKIAHVYRSAITPAPRAVKIELTARCDLQCFFCATRLKLRDKEDIPWDFYQRILLEMRKDGVEEIGLFYLGESMLYPRLVDAIYHAKRVCGYPYVFLTTNGRVASREKVYECVSAGLDSLKFSFNSADRSQFKEITNVDAFEHVVRHIKDARSAIDQVYDETGHRCGLYASSILYDGDQKNKMEKAVAEIAPYVDEHYYLPLYGQAGLTAGEKGTKPVAGNIGRVGALRDPIPCWSIFTEGHITFDGRLSACCFDHDGRFSMGDLNTSSFMESWNSAAFQSLRQAHLNNDVTGTACEKCVAYHA